MGLPIATEGPCAGHECDNCHICRRGRCCRKDNPHYMLPQEGEWDGLIYGSIGVLERGEDFVRCHCCGDEFRNVAQHAWLAHNLTPHEYRAIFGLNRRTPLVCEAFSRRMREEARAKRADGRMNRDFDGLPRSTPEQLLAANQRPHRTEGRRRASWAKGGRKTFACVVCGRPFTKLHRGRKWKVCSDACHREASRRAMLDRPKSPEHRARLSAYARARSETHASRLRASQEARAYAISPVPLHPERTCPQCGGMFVRPRWMQQRYCSQACATAARRAVS